MATATVTNAKTLTLAASTVDSITLTGSFMAVEIVHHGNVSNPIYAIVSTAATAPTVAGDNEEVMLAGERVRIPGVASNGTCVVSLISAGAATYTVIGVA